MAKEPAPAEERELNYPQITEPMVEIWLAQPVTKTFMQCLAWKWLDVRDQAGTGALIDSGNADLTHALLHRALGQQDAYAEAQMPESLLDHYEMIFHPPPEEEETPEGEETDE